MKTEQFSLERQIGMLLTTGAVLLFIPYTILSIIFEYPMVLRQETGVILTKFHEGGSILIMTWWAFAMVGLPLFGAFVYIGKRFEQEYTLMRLATVVGVIGLIVQMIGLLRWTFVVPVLAENYVNGDAMTRSASVVAFRLIHQFGGVILGEHIGQIFTIAWTVMTASVLAHSGVFPQWVKWFGYGASAIYLAAQLELFATVIPGTPVWALAGFIGSTLWLVWLIIVGVRFIRMN